MSSSGATSSSGLGALFRRWISPTPPAPDPEPEVAARAHRLIVIHPPEGVFDDLQEHLAEFQPDLEILAGGSDAAENGVALALPSDGGRRAADRWVTAHTPSAVVWMGSLDPHPLLDALVEGGIPGIAANVPALDMAALRAPRARRAVRAALGHFRVTFAQSQDAVRSLRVVAPASARVEALGTLSPLAAPPPSSAAERDEIAQALHARPTWLAALPDMSELPAILAAHRLALRGAHRLLLIIATEDEDAGSTLAARLRSEGWRVSRRGVEGEPDDTDEIFVADSVEEIGLWYGVAPITLLGGSLSGPHLTDPFGPACLGSAIIAGSHADGAETEPSQALLARLAAAGGILQIGRADDLALAVAELLAPDRAALRAHAAWDVVSDAARMHERLVTEIRVALRALPD